MVQMTATHTENKMTFEHSFTRDGELNYGKVIYAYQEQTLTHGTLAYSERQTADLADGGVATTQCDVIQLRSGRWVLATVDPDSTTRIDDVDADTAWSWINDRRAEHGFTS